MNEVAYTAPELTYWHAGLECCDSDWEAAYAAFESPEQEITKFRRRYQAFGADGWDRSTRIAELFCGRGNGLVALAGLGFTNLTGVDLAPSLLQQYRGPARLFVGDCRDLHLDDASLGVVSIHGGLHHLPDVEADLPKVIAEINRVLVPGGRVLIVEPWLTPFLRGIHAIARNSLARRMSSKVDALQRMIEREQQTYDAWLSRPDEIRRLLASHFETESLKTSLGKIQFCGRRA